MASLTTPDWRSIENGNTHRGVNRDVLKFLWQWNDRNPTQSLLDAPCGQGEFLKAVKQILPDVRIAGQDLLAEPLPEIAHAFRRGDQSKGFIDLDGQCFDVVTNISGVMCMDGASAIFSRTHDLLAPGGLFIVTNDNILTVRDRFSFLLFGRVKRFKLLMHPGEGNWNLMLIQSLWQLLRTNRFKVVRVEYTTVFTEDWIWLPFALLLYPLWWLSFAFKKEEMDGATRRALFPFKALLARHYVIYAQRED
jgi:hypothetical protein